MSWQDKILESVRETKKASFNAAGFSSGLKNLFLGRLAVNLDMQRKDIIRANQRDLERCGRSGLSGAFMDRLALTEKRIDKMAEAVNTVRLLPDPVGAKIWETRRPNGLLIERVRVPIGVIGIIYESRPDVTVEAAILCVKSGNCVILRGGREARHSNRMLVSILRKSLLEVSMPEEMVNLVSTGGRRAVRYLLSMSALIDLVIPRGGESLIETVVRNSRIPVIKHYKGVCHTYVDSDADMEMAIKVAVNAKVQRPSTCNATETLLVHRDIAPDFLPKIAEIFRSEKVEIRGCGETRKILPGIKPAVDSDWSTEYLDLVISVKVVDSADEAVEHINMHGTRHSESIITGNRDTAANFLSRVDAAAVFHNASTRFTDGGEFGLGAEIGISTDKIHARGPMGLEELTTYKYVIHGNGQTRQ